MPDIYSPHDHALVLYIESFSLVTPCQVVIKLEKLYFCRLIEFYGGFN